MGLRIAEASTEQPLSRIRITLRDKDHKLLISELTDEDGYVTFSRIGVGACLVEVKYSGIVFELPMAFRLDEGTPSSDQT